MYESKFFLLKFQLFKTDLCISGNIDCPPMFSTSTTNMSTATTIQELVFNALHKAATPNGTVPEFETPEAARDAYIAIVMNELFPGFVMPSASSSKTIVVAATEEKKPRAKKAKTEIPVLPASPKEEDAPAAAGAGKPKRAPKSEEEKAAAKAKRDAKKKTAEDVDALADGMAAMKISVEPNLKKMDPTWRKHLKASAKSLSKEVTKELEADLLTYLNGLSKEEFAGKKAEEHVNVFLAPPTASNAAAVETVATDLEIVEFEGTDYFVNPETKRVYEGTGKRDDDTGAYENYTAIGYVGMAAFANMKLVEE